MQIPPSKGYPATIIESRYW